MKGVRFEEMTLYNGRWLLHLKRGRGERERDDGDDAIELNDDPQRIE